MSRDAERTANKETRREKEQHIAGVNERKAQREARRIEKQRREAEKRAAGVVRQRGRRAIRAPSPPTASPEEGIASAEAEHGLWMFGAEHCGGSVRDGIGSGGDAGALGFDVGALGFGVFRSAGENGFRAGVYRGSGVPSPQRIAAAPNGFRPRPPEDHRPIRAGAAQGMGSIRGSAAQGAFGSNRMGPPSGLQGLHSFGPFFDPQQASTTAFQGFNPRWWTPTQLLYNPMLPPSYVPPSTVSVNGREGSER